MLGYMWKVWWETSPVVGVSGGCPTLFLAILLNYLYSSILQNGTRMNCRVAYALE